MEGLEDPITIEDTQELRRLIIKTMNKPSYITQDTQPYSQEEKDLHQSFKNSVIGYTPGQEENPLLIEDSPPPRRNLTRTRRFLVEEASEESPEPEIKELKEFICLGCKKLTKGHPKLVLGSSLFFCSKECERTTTQDEATMPHHCHWCLKGFDSIIDLFHNTFLGQDHSWCDEDCFSNYVIDARKKSIIVNCDECTNPLYNKDAIQEQNEEGDTLYFCSKECQEKFGEEEEEEDLEPEVCLECGEELEEGEEVEEFCNRECEKKYHRESRKRKIEDLSKEDLRTIIGQIGFVFSRYHIKF